MSLEQIWDWMGIPGKIVGVVVFVSMLYPVLRKCYYKLKCTDTAAIEKVKIDRWHSLLGIINSGAQKDVKRIRILQTWLPGKHRDIGEWRALLKSKADLSIDFLLTIPKIVEHRNIYRTDLDRTKDTMNGFNETEENIEKLIEEFPGRVRKLNYSCLPVCPMYILDKAVIIWGLYHPFTDSTNECMFRTPADSILGKYLMSIYEDLWKKLENDQVKLIKQISSQKA